MDQDHRARARPEAARNGADRDRRRAASARCPHETRGAEGLASAGLVVSAELRERLTTAVDEEAAYRTALRSLERRAFARFDLGRRLGAKDTRPRGGVGPPARCVARSSRRCGLCAQLRADAHRARPWPIAAHHDLLAMGVERSLIDRAVADGVGRGEPTAPRCRRRWPRRGRRASRTPRTGQTAAAAGLSGAPGVHADEK